MAVKPTEPTPVVFGNKDDNIVVNLPAVPAKGDTVDIYPDMVNDQTGTITHGRIVGKSIEVGKLLRPNEGGSDLPTFDYEVKGDAAPRVTPKP